MIQLNLTEQNTIFFAIYNWLEFWCGIQFTTGEVRECTPSPDELQMNNTSGCTHSSNTMCQVQQQESWLFTQLHVL